MRYPALIEFFYGKMKHNRTALRAGTVSTELHLETVEYQYCALCRTQEKEYLSVNFVFFDHFFRGKLSVFFYASSENFFYSISLTVFTSNHSLLCRL